MGNVFANGKEVSAKKNANKSIAAAMSVCLSPPSPPAGPLPIPYPVTDMASNTTDGTGSVYINKKEVGKKNGSNYKKCKGNEPATRSFGMDVVSHTIQGKTKFEAYSFNMMFEKLGAERFMDLTSTNHMNPATAFTTSVAGMAPPAPTQDDCDNLDQKNKDFREKNDEEDIKTREDGTDVTFGEFGTVSNGAFLPGGSSTATPMTGCSATGQLASANNNLCRPTTNVASTTVPTDGAGNPRTYVDNPANKKLGRAGKTFEPVPSSFAFPFCPGNQYEHPAGGLQGHAELNILNSIPQQPKPTTKADRLLLNIDWNHDGKKGDDKPCPNCQKAIKAACECMTIYICDKDRGEPVNRCDEPYKDDAGGAEVTGSMG